MHLGKQKEVGPISKKGLKITVILFFRVWFKPFINFKF